MPADSEPAVEADYMSDHVAHAPMEPMNATALVTGDAVEIWAPTQGPTKRLRGRGDRHHAR